MFLNIIIISQLTDALVSCVILTGKDYYAVAAICAHVPLIGRLFSSLFESLFESLPTDFDLSLNLFPLIWVAGESTRKVRSAEKIDGFAVF